MYDLVWMTCKEHPDLHFEKTQISGIMRDQADQARERYTGNTSKDYSDGLHQVLIVSLQE